MSERRLRRSVTWIPSVTLIALAAVLTACAPEGGDDSGASGGRRGMPGAGGSVGTGGASTGSGGSVGSGTGGSNGSGGAIVPGTGGAATGTGGAVDPGTGGTPAATGGSKGTGGAGNGGTTGSGGAATGGASGTGGRGTGGMTGSGGGGGGTAGVTGSGGAAGAGGSRLPPISDYGAMGPFPAIMEGSTGPNGKYTVYRPMTLGQNGFLHPPITFGPGISDAPDAAKLKGLLTIIASHGFVILATRLDGGPGAAANNTAMLNGLTWLIQQNSTPGIYQGKLDVTHAVAMGYSVGGTSAVAIAGHEAIITTVSIHGHKASSNMHGPLLQTSATGDTVGLPLQKETYAMSKVQTFLGIISGGSHAYPMQNNGGAERPAIIAWLRYWVYGDNGGKDYFYGDKCVMCGPPNWTTMFQRKNWQ